MADQMWKEFLELSKSLWEHDPQALWASSHMKLYKWWCVLQTGFFTYSESFVECFLTFAELDASTEELSAAKNESVTP